jgi:hypothetical protein
MLTKHLHFGSIRDWWISAEPALYIYSFISDAIDERKREEYLASRIPKPLPKRRRRRLTSTLDPRAQLRKTVTRPSRPWQKINGDFMNDQSYSIFFRLSLELRRAVYQQVFSGQVMHILVLLPVGKMGPVKCVRNHTDNVELAHKCWGRAAGQNYSIRDLDDTGVGRVAPGQELLPLLKTCRRV